MLGLVGLGFSSGLPRLLVFSTLTFWLVEVGISIKSVGLFAATALPYTLKFLWAPLIDRFDAPLLGRFFGRRRGWIFLFQIACGLALAGMGFTDPTVDPLRTAIAALLLAFSSASLDVVIDAYRVELLPDEEQGAGAAAAVFGYRLGMIIASAGALYLASFTGSWHVTYMVLGFVAAIPVTITLLMPRIEALREPKTWEDSIVGPFRQLSKKYGGKLLLILAFVVLYKFGDALAGVMANPLYVKLEFDKRTIADIAKTFGIVCSIFGVFLGGLLVQRGIKSALWIGGIVQCASNLMFVALFYAGNDVTVLTLTIAIENISGGIGTAAFVAYLSSLCDKKYTATQYAFLTATASVLRTTTASFSGFAVAEIGLAMFFTITAAVSLPALGLLYFLPDQKTDQT